MYQKIYVAIILALLFVGFAVGLHVLRNQSQQARENVVRYPPWPEEQLKSPLPIWDCGNPPRMVPKREDYPDIKVFHLAVSDFNAQSYAWIECEFIYSGKYIDDLKLWREQLIKDNEVIIQ